MRKIESCEVCGNKYLVTVLDLGNHALCDDLVKIGESRVCKQYPIVIGYCPKCKTAHQMFQPPKEELFPKDYHYRAFLTKDVLNGMEQLVNSCIQKFGNLEAKIVLDIGCNDGSLLSYFSEKGAVTIGVEPTDAYLDAQEKGHFVINDYFGQNVVNKVLGLYGQPDIITFTNVFAHIEDLPSLLASLKRLIGHNTVIIIENHYIGSILAHLQFDTFYHEHPRTYSLSSFLSIAEQLDIQVSDVEFPSRYGGNIRVYLTPNVTIDSKKITSVLLSEEKFLAEFENMNRCINIWKERKRAFLDDFIKTNGKLKAKAFPGRAAILIKLLGLDESHIEAVYEQVGSKKIGFYVPGTKIPILSDTQLFSDKKLDLPILNLAWHISGEIRDYLFRNGYTGNVINILSKEDLPL